MYNEKLNGEGCTVYCLQKNINQTGTTKRRPADERPLYIDGRYKNTALNHIGMPSASKKSVSHRKKVDYNLAVSLCAIINKEYLINP